MKNDIACYEIVLDGLYSTIRRLRVPKNADGQNYFRTFGEAKKFLVEYMGREAQLWRVAQRRARKIKWSEAYENA